VTEDKPRRRFVAEINIGADTAEGLMEAIDQLRFDLTSKQNKYGSLICNIISGSPRVGWTAIVTEDPNMTHERYFLDIEAWEERREK